MRPYLQSTLRKGCTDLQLLQSQDKDHAGMDAVSRLLAAAEAEPATEEDARGLPSVEDLVRSVFSVKASLIVVRAFVSTNNTVLTKAQPAYQAYIATMKRAVCSCDPNKWDPEKCNFHEESDHTIMDLTWGMSQGLAQLEGGEGCMVPASLPMVGTAALLSQCCKTWATQKPGDADKADNKRQPLADLFGKDGDFLLNSKGDGVNEALISSMIGRRAQYLLHGMAEIMVIPGSSRSKSYVNMTDIKNPALLESLLNWLTSTPAGQELVVEYEARHHASVHGSMTQGDKGVDAWSGVWAKVLKTALGSAESSSSAATAVETIDWSKHLPSGSKAVPKSMMPDSNNTEKNSEVKAEAAAPVTATATESSPAKATAAAAAACKWPETSPSVEDIYKMAEIPQAFGPVHCLDVIAIGLHVQNHLISEALLVQCPANCATDRQIK